MGKGKTDEIICNFFGIEVVTKNPNIARVLTADIGKLAKHDVCRIPTVKRITRGERLNKSIQKREIKPVLVP